MKQRIWELDALRGICIIAVVIVHAIYDLTELYGILDWTYPGWFSFLKDWGGVVFLILSGTCVTLGSHSVRRGMVVLGCGMLCSAVTFVMSRMGFDPSVIIYFGVLHCLGVCMIVWPLLRRCPWWLLAVLGACLTALGFYVSTVQVRTPWLIPLGLMFPTFTTSDYFPLLPHMGFFLLGAALGRTLYRKKESLLPAIDPQRFPIRQLCLWGRSSLWIYLLHQPLLSALCWLLTL